LQITTEPLRRTERIRAAVWATPGAKTPGLSANARASAAIACTVTASGRTCARTIRSQRPGRIRVTLR
jgi:hypothetical protein